MHYPVSCLVLLFASQWAPVCASSHFLASRKSKEIHAAQENLRAQTARLTQAIRQELGPSTPLPVIVVAAQDLLGEEAGKLQHDDRAGAKRLRQFAQELSPASLVLSPYEDVLPVPVEAADSATASLFAGSSDNKQSPAVSSMSEETVIERDGNGHAVARTTRCKDGLCVRETDVASEPSNKMSQTRLHNVVGAGSGESSEESKAVLGHDVHASSSLHRKARKLDRIARKSQKEKARQARKAARKAVRDLDKAMHEMMQSFGNEGFDSILRDFLAAKNKKHGDSPHDEISKSSSTVIQDGRLVQETKTCRNGKCTTSVEERVIGNNPGPTEEHAISEQKEHRIDQRAVETPSRKGTSIQNQPNEIILVGAGPASPNGAFW